MDNLFILYRTLRRSRKLSAERSPMYDLSRAMRWLTWIGMVVVAAYFVFFGVMTANILKETVRHLEAWHVLNQCLTIFLFLDFAIRLILPTPAQSVRPYLLLPVRRRSVMLCLLTDYVTDPMNFFSLFFFTPFALLTITPFYGLAGVLTYSLGIWLMMTLDGLWAMLVKQLVRDRFSFVALPLAVYGALVLMEFIPSRGWTSTASMYVGEWFVRGTPWAFLAVVALIVAMVFVNWRVQTRLIYSELSHQSDTRVKRLRSWAFLSRFGMVGEYMRLELRLILRNKSMSRPFWSFLVLIPMMALLLSREEIGDMSLFTMFYVFYCYMMMSFVSLVKIMSTEGNYIEALMIHKQSIYDLLCAKYYVQCILLVIPFIFMLIPVCCGTVTLLMSLSFMLFMMGPVFAIMIQFAPYNDKTAELHSGGFITKKQGNVKYQLIILAFSLLVPSLLVMFLSIFFSDSMVCIIIALIGIATFAAHPLWIRDAYCRFMRRRYISMEGFRNSR